MAPDAPARSSDAWPEALRVAACCAVDPAGLGGVLLHAPAGPVRDAWLRELRALMPHDAPVLRVPLNVADERLLGGLDLAATLATSRPVSQRGLLAEADGGILLLAMAERISTGTAARLSAVLDSGEVNVARDGVAMRHASRIGLVALDEGEADEGVAAGLADRLAFWLDLSSVTPRDAVADGVRASVVGAHSLAAPAVNAAAVDAASVHAARRRLPAVRIGDELLTALCRAAQELGILSLRAPWLAARVACVVAALAGRDEATREDIALGARWVIGPRARARPVVAEPPSEVEETPRPETSPDGADEPSRARAQQAADPPARPDSPSPQPDASLSDPASSLADEVIEAAVATLPPHLLDAFAPGAAQGPHAARAGRSGASRDAGHRGAPLGAVRGDVRSGKRLDVLATLRAAAPWQRLRREHKDNDSAAASAVMSMAASTAIPAGATLRIAVRSDDFRVKRFRERRQTTVIFVVDASGSSALHRLDEAKGAVVLLLSDCYSRRDSVALLAFRGQGTELLLPPTRSLVRARRCLNGLPGGGATPLAGAIEATAALADSVRRHGDTPLAVLLTDGRANIARDGTPGRDRAQADALQAARQLRASGLASTVVDTSPRPQAHALHLAQQMGARYVQLAHADAHGVSQAVRNAKHAQMLEAA